MGTIQIRDVSFRYDQMTMNLFNKINLKIDVSWKLGLIGRNGRGKTTLLKIIMGQLAFSGEIVSNLNFYYYPQTVVDNDVPTTKVVKNLAHLEDYDLWKIEIELEKLKVDVSVLQQRFSSLSPGEQTKILLAILFLDETGFQLIDEPTNHLDIEGRKVVSNYLKGKKGFIVISHDKTFLNPVIDHVISIDRNDISVYKGNFDTWQQQKSYQDERELLKKEQLKKDISRLKATANKRKNWAVQSEVNPDSTGRKMMKKAQNILKRVDDSVLEKQALLKNIEIEEPLKFNYQELKYSKNLLQVTDLYLKFENITIPKISFRVEINQVVSLIGPNGVGKTSIVKEILGLSHIKQSGDIELAKALKISYLCQDNELQGKIKQLAILKKVEPELVFSNLRKLGFERYLFEQPIEQMSQGQRQKVALAISLSERANLYFWDEPLNYLDVITRQQVIEAIKKQHPTMLLIDHDQDLIYSVSNVKVYLHY